MKPSVLIIGAGIIGSTTAYFLAKQGVSCTVIDKAGIAGEASGDNGGAVSVMPGLATGTLDFLRASIGLIHDAEQELEEDFELYRDGWLMAALNDEEFSEKITLSEAAKAAGIAVELLEGDAARAFEPALGGDVRGALYVKGAGHIQPRQMTRAFAGAAQRLGARFVTDTPVLGFEVSDGRVAGVRTARDVHLADQTVLAAGAWSAALGTSIGLNIPVAPAKGHMLATFPSKPISTRLFLGSAGGVRQWRNGEVVIGTDIEYAGFDYSVNRDATEKFVAQARRMLPALSDLAVRRIWTGMRPTTPDSLPIIGAAQGIDNLWIATGHGTTGMMYGPGTGKAVAELVVSGTSTLAIDKFAPTRFPTIDGRSYRKIESGIYGV